MKPSKVIIEVSINAPKEKVWQYYTSPEHITKWNFADPSWHCPNAENDMKIGGRYLARMEAKDGSFGFDFEAIYSQIIDGEQFTYGFADRTVNVKFTSEGNQATVVITFDPENINPVERQRAGWQSILNNFKNYTENN